MMQIVVLLYHLFTGADNSTNNLRHKLIVAPRASTTRSRANLRRLDVESAHIDLPKDTLQRLVDGPELESIRAAFHIEGDVPASRPTQTGEDADQSAARIQCADLV
ncbi:hypothetical protein V8D89_003162 [Ganoderma adspersum]